MCHHAGLGIEPRSSGRAAGGLNRSPVPTPSVETGSHCIALAALEFNIQTRVASVSHILPDSASGELGF